MLYRAWINQPSTLDELHKLHGKYCIVSEDEKSSKFVTLYFTEGDLHSMTAPKKCINRCFISAAEQKSA